MSVNPLFNRLGLAEKTVKDYAKAVLRQPTRKEAQKCYKDALKIRDEILKELAI